MRSKTNGGEDWVNEEANRALLGTRPLEGVRGNFPAPNVFRGDLLW